MKILKSILLSLSSFSLGIVLLGMQINIPFLKIENKWYYNITKFVGMIVIGAILAFMLLKIFTKKHSDVATIKSVKPLESSVIPSYMGLFVIMLGFPNLSTSTILTIFLLFVLWAAFEKNYYFNIFWSILGYRFYEVEDINGNVITLITKTKDMKNTSKEREINNLARINNFTFIEVMKCQKDCLQK